MAKKTKERLTAAIRLPLSPERLAAWKIEAEKYGLPVTSWIRLRVEGLLTSVPA